MSELETITVDTGNTAIVVLTAISDDFDKWSIEKPVYVSNMGTEVRSFDRYRISKGIAQLYYRLPAGRTALSFKLRYNGPFGREWFIKKFPTFESLRDSDYAKDLGLNFTPEDEMNYPIYWDNYPLNPDVKIVQKELMFFRNGLD